MRTAAILIFLLFSAVIAPVAAASEVKKVTVYKRDTGAKLGIIDFSSKPPALKAETPGQDFDDLKKEWETLSQKKLPLDGESHTAEGREYYTKMVAPEDSDFMYAVGEKLRRDSRYEIKYNNE